MQYSEEIHRWGMIGYSGFTKGALLHKKFHKLSLYLLEPAIWSVGKMARYTLDDVKDMEVVFKKQKYDSKLLLKIWAQALLESPRSSEQNLFIKKIQDFLKHSGPKIWGKNFKSETAFQFFLKLISAH